VAVILESLNCETGGATFWLAGREAFRVMEVLFGGRIEATRINSGIYVTIHPEALTDEFGSTNIHAAPGAGIEDQRDFELDLFAVRLESPEDERC